MYLNFSIQIRRIFLTKLVFFTFLAIALLVIDKNSSTLKTTRFYLSYLTVPIEQIMTLPNDILNYLKKTISLKQSLLEENSKYKIENKLLKASAKQYLAIELENLRLKKMLNATYEINSQKLLIARVIGANNSLTKNSISIDKGSTNNVYLGQSILDDKGIMGQVIDVKPMSSTVLLISDYQNYTSVMLKKSGRRFLAQGNGNNLIIKNIDNIQEIKVGDEIVTSGLSGLYPSGYPVGVVSKIVSSKSGINTYSLKIDAFAGLNLSQEVILVWTKKNKNLYQLASGATKLTKITHKTSMLAKVIKRIGGLISTRTNQTQAKKRGQKVVEKKVIKRDIKIIKNNQ